MQQNPIADKTNELVTTSLEFTLGTVRHILRVPQNRDVIIRRLQCSGFSVALVFLDGMVTQQILDLHVISPLLTTTYDGDPAGRVEWLTSAVLQVAGLTVSEKIDELVASVLMGDLALLVDGCPHAITIDVKGYQRRNIARSINEATILGPHEGFVENMKTNITMIRRVLQTPRLVSEIIPVGSGIPMNCSLVYLDGVTNEQILTELRRRLVGINFDYVMSIGELEQMIEDQPFALLPQMVQTERPDRVVSFLVSGMPIVFFEGAPTALAVPSSLRHMMHTPDVSSLRFPSGMFKRLLIYIGISITALLPGIYLSVALYHNEVLPLALITSIFETESRIPIPLFFELFFLNLGFDLILEAGARMPAVLSNGLGAISALILGQSVVSADLVSPMMIVIAAMCGLGSLIVSNYRLSISLRIFQYFLMLAAAIAGFFGMLLLLLGAYIELLSSTSLGVPFEWAHSPSRMHNPDVVFRYPVWQQRIRFYLSNPAQFFRAKGRARAWEKPKEDRDE